MRIETEPGIAARERARRDAGERVTAARTAGARAQTAALRGAAIAAKV